MAFLKKIVVRDFRNIALAELDFSPNINCISGGNGEGKTNLLDAVYYLSMTKSAFAASDRFCFRYGSEEFAISGLYGMKDSETRFSVRSSISGEKKLKKDDKVYAKVSDHIGKLPVVMVSPSDVSLVSESGEERRRFLNQVLSQMSGQYLSDMQQYNRLLAQRNQFLKNKNQDDSLLDIMDESLSYYASSIYDRRKEFVKKLSPIASGYYSILSGGRESVSVEYRSDLNKEQLSALLRECRQKDLMFGYTTAGIQRDDIVFLMDGHSIRRCGSQGQQKSFLVSLKFAQYDIMKSDSGVPPILLLDDVFDKLDMNRTANLLKMVAGREFGQIFITDSNKVRLSGIVDSVTEDRAYFEASGGAFVKEEL